jgi:acyl-CoA synthetase (AMP-forming)/AMP-acid ligase II
MSITQALHRSVQATPEQIATRCGDRTRTFAEQAERVARLAGALRALGVEPGDRIAVLGVNSDRYLEFLLGASWAGAMFNPLNIRWSLLELEYGINDSQSRVLAVDDQFVAMAGDLRNRCSSIKQVIYLGDGRCPDGMLSFEDMISGGDLVADAGVPATSPAGLFYTGGTTGAPRGVTLSHANLLESALGSLASGDVLSPGPMLHVAPLFHLAGIWPWLIQMEVGGTHVILPGFDPERVIAAAEEYSVANVLLVPTMIQRLLDHVVSKNLAIPSLRRLLYAGSPIPEVVLDQLQRVLPDVELCQVYGMTELAPVATVLLPADHVGTPRRSAGRAAAHAKVRVVGPGDRDLPPGDVGEILVQGPNVMLGYWNKQEETATALRDGWMHTGDAGYLDDGGFLYVVDRIKDMIVTGGENVYSVEVENAVLSHSAVASCAVIGVPDERWGERVHAVVVLEPGCALDINELRSHLKARIAGYKAPHSLETIEALPISAAGKILKRELRVRHKGIKEGK